MLPPAIYGTSMVGLVALMWAMYALQEFDHRGANQPHNPHVGSSSSLRAQVVGSIRPLLPGTIGAEYTPILAIGLKQEAQADATQSALDD